MDKAAFGSQSLGRLEKIVVLGGSDWAFVPNPLPSDFEVSNDLKDLLGDAREQLGCLSGIGRTLDNSSLILRPLQNREAIHSSSLEGTHATPVELLRYNIDPQAPESASDERNARLEVRNYYKALRIGHRLLSREKLPLSSRLILEVHGRLLRGVRGEDKMPGQFRNRQVHVGSGRRFIPPPAPYVLDLMSDLERFMNARSSMNPLIRAFLVHYQFETIHPFLDGNGRIGRVLLALCISHWHKHRHPWLYLSPFFDKYKDEYVEALYRVSSDGDWDRWLRFCLLGTIEQCKDSIHRIDALNRVKRQLYEEHSGAFSRAHRLIGKLFESPVFVVAEVMKWCDITRPTAQKDIDTLVARGVVELLDSSKPRTYWVPKIINVAFDDLAN